MIYEPAPSVIGNKALILPVYLSECRPTLITAVETGQINVSKWSRRDHADAMFGAIAEKTEA